MNNFDTVQWLHETIHILVSCVLDIAAMVLTCIGVIRILIAEFRRHLSRRDSDK